MKKETKYLIKSTAIGILSLYAGEKCKEQAKKHNSSYLRAVSTALKTIGVISVGTPLMPVIGLIICPEYSDKKD